MFMLFEGLFDRQIDNRRHLSTVQKYDLKITPKLNNFLVNSRDKPLKRKFLKAYF
jgi:hypothetical protein